jgi:hypothetical protein
MKKPAISARTHGSLLILGLALLFPVAAYLLRSTLWSYVGLVVVAVALRFRKRPAGCEYACFVMVALAGSAWIVASDSTTLPVLGAVPLMLSYVFDYLEERKDKRAAPFPAEPPEGRGAAATNNPANEKGTKP